METVQKDMTYYYYLLIFVEFIYRISPLKQLKGIKYINNQWLGVRKNKTFRHMVLDKWNLLNLWNSKFGINDSKSLESWN